MCFLSIVSFSVNEKYSSPFFIYLLHFVIPAICTVCPLMELYEIVDGEVCQYKQHYVNEYHDCLGDVGGHQVVHHDEQH